MSDHYGDQREKDIEQSKRKEVQTAKRPINRNAKEAMWVTYD